MNKFAIAGVVCAGLTLSATTASAPTGVVVRHVNLHPTTRAEAARTLAKIDDAALDVCGASGFSLRETKAAIRASHCWQDAVGGAVRQTGDPMLSESFARFATTGR